MPEGNKSRVSGDGLKSNRPETNLPLGSVGSNQIYRMVKKNALVVKNRRADLMGARGWTLLSLPQTLSQTRQCSSRHYEKRLRPHDL